MLLSIYNNLAAQKGGSFLEQLILHERAKGPPGVLTNSAKYDPGLLTCSGPGPGKTHINKSTQKSAFCFYKTYTDQAVPAQSRGDPYACFLTHTRHEAQQSCAGCKYDNSKNKTKEERKLL